VSTGVSLGDVVAACAARLGDDARAVLARIGGSLGASARAVPALARERRAEIAAVARVPGAPAALRGVHPSWIEAALARLPARARTALSAPHDATDVWLARCATAELALVTVVWIPREPAAWLRRIALEQLAFALGPRAAALPELRDVVVRGRDLGPQRAAVERCRDAKLGDETALIRVAARALAPHLAHQPHGLRVISRRLPREVGLEFERVVVECSSVAIDQVPAWSALAGA
jgi:hypothetical protein